MMVDPEVVIEQRREARLRRIDPTPPPAESCGLWTPRMFLALHRGDRWPVERIARQFRIAEAQVRASIERARAAEEA